MERIKNLNSYQKGVLIFMTFMTLIFAVIYVKTISTVGYRYHDAILVPIQETGQTIYKGKIQGKQAKFIVAEDKSVVFKYGNKIYGTYIMKEDPTAIPKEDEQSEQMIGVEIYKNNELLFRGGIWDSGDFCWLYNEDGTLDNMGISVYTTYGVEYDDNGNVVDRMEPSAVTIYELVNGPKLTHKGVMQAWFGGVFICILNLLSILFVDELFLWNLAFQIRNVENAEPSDWQIAGRYIGWTGMVIMAMLMFIMGLQ
ncbi:MAG: hypothetical protein IKW28_05955 [Lachnospiraceae bacterium]|nr:hypothetical protein [Lachnospiraceae bacterium]